MSPGRPDTDVVRRHLVALDEALVHLGRHAHVSVEDLSRDTDLRWSVERGVQLCAQNVLDVATHVAASAGRATPDYATAVDQLGELGVLPHEFARRLREVAGFRNVLVHGYLEVDLRRLHDVLVRRLGDFREFARHVDAWLSSKTAR